MIASFKTTNFLLIFLLFFGKETYGRIVNITNISSRFSPKYFSNVSLTNHNGSVFLDMMVIKTLQAGFKANAQLQLRLNNSKSYQTIFDNTIDVCNLVVSLKDTIFKKWFQSLLKYGNFMQNCPVVEGHYYLNGWKMDPSMMPSFLYPGDYRVRGYAFMGRVKSKNKDFVVQIEVDAKVS